MLDLLQSSVHLKRCHHRRPRMHIQIQTSSNTEIPNLHVMARGPTRRTVHIRFSDIRHQAGGAVGPLCPKSRERCDSQIGKALEAS